MRSGDEGEIGSARNGESVASRQRLVEQRNLLPDSAEATVVALLQSQRPYRMPPGRRYRVDALLARRSRRRWTPSFLRPAVIVGLCACGAAFAGTRLFGWPLWISGRGARGTARVLAVPPARPARDRPKVALRAPADVNETTSPQAAAPSAPKPARSIARAVRRRDPARVNIVGTSGDSGAQVLAAVRALRQAHDPVRARSLLAGYLRDHPHGTLAQEALALSIEAAVVNRDADAAALASSYLRTYPDGAFRAQAQRVLAR